MSSTGQDGLPELGIGDTVGVEDANSVLVVGLLGAGGWRRGGSQVERNGHCQGLRIDCEGDAFVGSAHFFKLGLG